MFASSMAERQYQPQLDLAPSKTNSPSPDRGEGDKGSKSKEAKELISKRLNIKPFCDIYFKCEDDLVIAKSM